MRRQKPKRRLKPEVIVPIVVALIALIGVICAAFIGNIDKWSSKVATSSPTATNTSPARRNITGTWVSGTGRYEATQESNRVVWDGIGRYGNKVWHHKGTGTIDGDTIIATMEELPDSNYPGIPGGARTEGTISSDWQTITWIGQNDQERVWHRNN